MSQLAQDVFASARAAGLLVPGFVGSFADVKEALNALAAEDDYQPDEDGDLAYQRHLENQGWYAAQAQEAYEAQYGFLGFAVEGVEYDDKPMVFESAGSIVNGVVKPLFTAENDPDGEAENAWHEQQGEQWAESRASAWFNFPGDRH